MIRLEKLGAWYSDITIVGDWCCLFADSHIEYCNAYTKQHLPVDLPGENVLFLSIYRDDNTIYLYGQGGKTGNAWIYRSDRQEWIALGKCFGTVRPVLIANGLVYVVTDGNHYKVYLLGHFESPLAQKTQQIGVNGIRKVESNGTIITGDETYDGSHLSVNLAEYTQLQDICIGQSYIEGCVAAFDATRVVIEYGDCKFIRFYRDGFNLAIAIVKQLENKAVFYWLRIDELYNFPTEISKPKDPDKKGDDPVPELIPSFSSLLELIKSKLIQKGESIEGPNCGKIVWEFCWATRDTGFNFGLLSKESGNNFQGCATDYIVLPDDRLQDVLGDGGGANTIQWGDFRQPADSEKNRYVKVSKDPGFLSGIGIDNNNPPVDNGNIEAKLNKRIEELENNFNNKLQSCLKDGDSIAIRSNRGRYIRDDWGDDLGKFDRMEAGGGEIYKIEKH